MSAKGVEADSKILLFSLILCGFSLSRTLKWSEGLFFLEYCKFKINVIIDNMH